MRVGFVLRSAEIKPLFFDLFRSNQTKTISGKRARTRVSSFPAAPSSNSLFIEWTNWVQHLPAFLSAQNREKRKAAAATHQTLQSKQKPNPFFNWEVVSALLIGVVTLFHMWHMFTQSRAEKTASLFTRAPGLHQLKCQTQYWLGSQTRDSVKREAIMPKKNLHRPSPSLMIPLIISLLPLYST